MQNTPAFKKSVDLEADWAERSGSVDRALDWGSKGASQSHTVSVSLCCFLEHCALFAANDIGSTQKDLSRLDLKIVDWDVKNQIEQTKKRAEWKTSQLIWFYSALKQDTCLKRPLKRKTKMCSF